MDIDELARAPWEKQIGETARNFHCFQHFLHLVPWQRSMRQAFTDHQAQCLGKTPTKNLHATKDWQALRFRFTWVERADAHDRHITERDRLQRLAAIEAMNRKHAELAGRVQALVIARLEQIAEGKLILEMSPVALARVLDVASTVERRALGQPSEIIKHTNDAAGEGVPLDLSPLSDQELVLFQQLIDKCKQTSGILSV